MSVFEAGECDFGEESLAIIMAERAIRNQIHNYARAQDRWDPELLERVCHPDCIIDYGDTGGPRGSVEEAKRAFFGDPDRWAAHTHEIGNIAIKVKGDRAVSECYISGALRGRPDENGDSIDMHVRGRYLDRWSKREGLWALDYRKLVSEFGWMQEVVKGQLASVGNPRQDRSDPVYALFAELG